MMAKILVVDDALVMRQLLKAILEQEGHSVCLAEDGTDALEFSRTNSVDMVITDINMPKMSGISLVSKLRRLDNYANIPILMVTTESAEYKKNKAKHMGADGWLQKPITEERVVKAVRAMFARRKSA